MRRDQPPRPLAVGDVVAVHSEALGAWTASQVTSINVVAKCAAVLELDWCGPEPATVAIADLAARGDLDLPIARRFTLADLAEAHRLLETGSQRGKLVLTLA
ncbi:zinc-binding dehydrogenase [Streptomyces sp. NPDC006368]|uniref:zinc-binding dehydrogenase n=1 Tax=Streptomyces sp. NPDC006368 TaxID=3156760 RepID=UPI0033AF3E8C